MHFSLKAIFVTALLCGGTQALDAQGVLPSPASVTVSTEPVSRRPILIGDQIPTTVTVLDSSETVRSLLSFKAAIEVLAVAFLSPDCAEEGASRFDWKRFYEEYKDWHVAFVAVSIGNEPAALRLADDLKTTGLPLRVVRAPRTRAAQALRIERTPTLLLIDESGVLRYRGPLGLSSSKRPGDRRKYGREALEAIIGHTDSVPNPEPPTEAGCAVTK